MQKIKQYLAYVLIDPNTNIPRYIGITTQSLEKRLQGHLRDVISRPNLNKHKTNWFNSLNKIGLTPKIQLVKECSCLEELKQFEVDYIKQYKEKYKLINQTIGGDMPGFNIHSRETILAKTTTRPIVQYNILGEKIAEYEMTEDVKRTLDLKDKSCSHITQCCRGIRNTAYGYIWRYKEDPLGDISHIDPYSLELNYLIQCDLNGKELNQFETAKEAVKTVGLKSACNISSVLKGQQKTLKGFLWKVKPKYIYYDSQLLMKVYSRKIKNINKQHNKYLIQCFDLEDNFIAEFKSFLEASEKIYKNTHYRKQVADCCLGIKEYWKGYKWKKVSINPSNSENELNESTQS